MMARRLSVLMGLVLLMSPIYAIGGPWITPEPHRVADHFDASVEGLSGPVPGIEIIVERRNGTTNDYEQVVSARTDTAGVAHFQELGPGKYLLSTHLALDNDFVDIVVAKDTRQPREDKIVLHWPTSRVLHAKHLRGSFASFPDDDGPSIALEGIKLTLLEGYSGREIAGKATSSDGGFAFEGMSPGLYFLRLEESKTSGILRPWGRQDFKGDIPIELNPTDAGAPDAIELRINPCFDCGRTMMYKVVQ